MRRPRPGETRQAVAAAKGGSTSRHTAEVPLAGRKTATGPGPAVRAAGLSRRDGDDSQAAVRSGQQCPKSQEETHQ